MASVRVTRAARILAVLVVVTAMADPCGALAQSPQPPAIIERPQLSIGDWWEFREDSRTWRLTVIAREGDQYVLARSARGESVHDGFGRTIYHADAKGIARTIEPGGKVTEAGDRLEWVRFPLAVGSRWFFTAFTNVVGRPRTEFRMYDYDCRVEGWDTIEIDGRPVRALKISYTPKVRGGSYRAGLTGWYAPEAKLLVRLTPQYAGGFRRDVIAFGIRTGDAPAIAAQPQPRPGSTETAAPTPPAPAPATAPPSTTIAPPAGTGADTKAPQIVVNYPAADTRVDRDEITVIGIVTDDTVVARVHVSVNGQDVPLPAEVTSGARGTPIRAVAKLRPGDNVIEITAMDTAGNIAQVVRAVSRVVPPRAPTAGTRLAVVIGVGDYESTAIPKLRYAARDAEAIYQVLVGSAGFKEEHVLLLTDRTTQRPTLRNIKSALGTFLARSAHKEDTVLVFFAGHGAPEVDPRGLERDGLAKYLVPSDADPNDLYATALSMDEIHTIFGRIEAERIVVFLDACYSGAAGGRTFASTRLRTRELGVDDLFLERLTRAKGRAIITASRPSEVSLELPDLGHGVFSYYLVEGLKGAADLNRDGIVTLQELYEYTEQHVSRKSRAVGGNQHPVMKGELEGLLPLVRIRR
jgi:hypothetical protein